jgi:hypothetical protein
MGGGVRVELKRASDSVDHLRRRVLIPALLQPQVVIGADARERCQLLTPQPRNAPTPGRLQAHVFGPHQRSPGAQELTKARAPRHLTTIRRPAFAACPWYSQDAQGSG